MKTRKARLKFGQEIGRARQKTKMSDPMSDRRQNQY